MTIAPVYYNENDPKAAAWLRELITQGHLPHGVVDERSIEDVRPVDIIEYKQCHFFAGIGGWALALQLAGWPDDRPVWTGSCPCQPFSAAGKRKGFADERHLWPAWFHLIRELQPLRVFGEQVANALPWFDLISDDLEEERYAVGAAIIGAHSVGAPHIRQRLYWVADTNGGNASTEREQRSGQHGLQPQGGSTDQLADSLSGQQQKCAELDGEAQQNTADRSSRGQHADGRRGLCGLGNTYDEGPQRLPIRWDSTSERTTWSADLVSCRDGKWRPVEPGAFPLANGIPGRVGLLRGYGNAIVPQVAATFIEAYRSVTALT